MDERILKQDIVSYTARKAQITEAKAKEVLHLFFNYIAENVRAGKIVSINKFGSFELKRKKEKRTLYDIRARKVRTCDIRSSYIKFTNSKGLKKYLSIDNIDNIDNKL